MLNMVLNGYGLYRPRLSVMIFWYAVRTLHWIEYV
jgi:hypothetical protein